jgi:hypothetical protein
MHPGNATIVVHHSMVRLPETPMRPRIADDRVGFFTTTQVDYSRDEKRAAEVHYIDRWRLEKKDPDAPVSDPVKPIVYYIDSATPVKWRDWIRKGVESWQPALEAAGFPQRHRCEHGARSERRPRLQPGRHPPFRDPLAALHH